MKKLKKELEAPTFSTDEDFEEMKQPNRRLNKVREDRKK